MPIKSCFSLFKLQPDGDAGAFQIGREIELGAVLAEPLLVFPVFRHDAFHHIPEILGVVHVGQVAELMDHHIVEDLWRSEDQAVIEGECPSGGTASPTAFLVAYGDGGIITSGQLMIVCNSLGKKVAGRVAVAPLQGLEAFDFCFGQAEWGCDLHRLRFLFKLEFVNHEKFIKRYLIPQPLL